MYSSGGVIDFVVKVDFVVIYFLNNFSYCLFIWRFVM